MKTRLKWTPKREREACTYGWFVHEMISWFLFHWPTILFGPQCGGYARPSSGRNIASKSLQMRYANLRSNKCVLWKSTILMADLFFRQVFIYLIISNGSISNCLRIWSNFLFVIHSIPKCMVFRSYTAHSVAIAGWMKWTWTRSSIQLLHTVINRHQWGYIRAESA